MPINMTIKIKIDKLIKKHNKWTQEKQKKLEKKKKVLIISLFMKKTAHPYGFMVNFINHLSRKNTIPT